MRHKQKEKSQNFSIRDEETKQIKLISAKKIESQEQMLSLVKRD